MNKYGFIEEVEKKLKQMFESSRDGMVPPAKQRHRLEGFIEAGVFMGMARNEEIADLMEKVHYEVFNMSMQDHKMQHLFSWTDKKIDYSPYDAPTYERRQNK